MNWNLVADELAKLANSEPRTGAPVDVDGWQLNDGQRTSLLAIGARLPGNGVVIADEVGMGKTRIAVGVARSVIRCGGRVAIVVPPGLGYQWRDELRLGGIEAPPILRSLWQYLAAWEPEPAEKQQPWFRQPAVLISHAFTNWRLGANTPAWRWALLPEVYAQWRRCRQGRFPRGFHGNESLDDPWVKRAAQSIVGAAGDTTAAGSRLQGLLDELSNDTPWPGALDPAAYAADEHLRPWLERAVGLGLGVFDLVIIDEAHKSRGTDSGLTRLLESVLQTSDTARRVGMTATPVELDASQWKGTLGRIGAVGDSIEEIVRNFAGTVRGVRKSPSNEDARRSYLEAARTFESTLAPYLLRRDKRQDFGVRAFVNYTGEPAYAYRREREILVEPANLTESWKQTVCAAEALSLVARNADDPVAKRLRLTLGNGHGIAALVDQMTRDSVSDRKEEIDDGADLGARDEADNDTGDKRLQRARWWRDVIARTVGTSDKPLLEHPAILSAVDAIEDAHRQGEKVLVFGRFTRPLQELVRLLNARELLRCLEQGRPWPQSKVHDDEWPAIEATQRQLGCTDRASLDEQLARQYGEIERRRERFRAELVDNIQLGMSSQSAEGRAARLFAAFRNSLEAPQPELNNRPLLALVARALQDLLPDADQPHSPELLARAFAELVDALSERDEGDNDGDGGFAEAEASELWPKLAQRVAEEYDRPQGGFARLMYGDTKPETRRLLQLAFNRQHSYPGVLVAQSMVGREGLNLHRACRIVVLLHPEWNPGVVEQQIGRVDRLGSRWELGCSEAMENGLAPGNLPRIEVRPVIFKGTYDEKNWEVLRERWDDLRAQLHGVIIPPHEAEAYGGMGAIISEINDAAPNFAPPSSK